MSSTNLATMYMYLTVNTKRILNITELNPIDIKGHKLT